MGWGLGLKPEGEWELPFMEKTGVTCVKEKESRILREEQQMQNEGEAV